MQYWISEVHLYCRLLSDQDFSSKYCTQWWNLCKHTKKGLESKSWITTRTDCKFHWTVNFILCISFNQFVWYDLTENCEFRLVVQLLLLRLHHGFYLTWQQSMPLQVVRCLLIEPYPESALNEQAGKMLLENYDEYARHARWGLHNPSLYLTPLYVIRLIFHDVEL